MDPLEILWDRLLSRDPQAVRDVFAALDGSERRSVLAHLRRMVTESDWHPEQRLSAQAALDALEQSPPAAGTGGKPGL